MAISRPKSAGRTEWFAGVQAHLRSVLGAVGLWVVPSGVTVSQANHALKDGAITEPAIVAQLDRALGLLLSWKVQ